MSDFVWEVTATGGDPQAIRTAIATAIEQLRDSTVSVPELEKEPELDSWREDVSFVTVGEPATDHDRVSVLIDISLFDQDPVLAAQTAGVLSGGFDTLIGDFVMNVPGVTDYSHSDRIARS